MGKCHWIEIDLPEVIQLKREFIKSTSSAYNDCERVDRVKGIFFFRELGLTLISCDLSNYRDLCIKVDRVLHKVGCPEKICVLNEVCLSYSSEDQARSILRTVTNVDEIHDCCHYIHYVGYEPVKFIRNSQFGNIMTSHFDSMGHPLKHFPTPQQLRSLFRSLKFYELDVSSMFKMYHYHAEIEPLRAAVDGLEPFDEFEEMDLYLGHYALVTGAREMWSVINEPLDLISEDPCEDFEPISTIDEDEDGLMVLRENPVRRYGHTACLIDDSTGRQTVFVAGGFGTDHSQSTKQQHKRLSDCLLLSRESDSQDWLVTSLENRVTSTTIDPFQRMHAQTCRLSDNVVFIHGGRQSPTSKSIKERNLPILCRIDRTDSSIQSEIVKFTDDLSESDLCEHIRWRHKLLNLSDGKIFRVGGLTAPSSSSRSQTVGSIGVYDLNAQNFKLIGPKSCSGLDSPSCFDRHSFGADMRDQNSFLLFGGLQTMNHCRDLRVEPEHSVILCDTRALFPSEGRSYQLSAKAASQSYGSSVHFVNENQFVKFGGISTETGLEETHLGLYDLRSDFSVPISRKLLPSYRGEKSDPKPEETFLLTNYVSYHLKSLDSICTIGGGGNYFTFGTYLNRSELGIKIE